MSEHPPGPATAGQPTTPHHSDPAGPTAQEPAVDLIAGDPPAPITVWRTAVPRRLAHRLVAAYSCPGEVVLDLTDGHTLAAAALAGGRHHRPAWFTDASAMILGPVTPATPNHPDPDHPGHPAGAAADATTEDGPDTGVRLPVRRSDAGHASTSGPARAGRRQPPPAGWWASEPADPPTPTAGTKPDPPVSAVTGLVAACWPLAPADPANRTRLGWLLRIGTALLRSGGCLALIVRAGSGTPVAPADAGALVAAAAEAGLGYLQHIVAVHAPVDGDRFTYYASPAELAALTAGHHDNHGCGPAVRHLRVHSDLLIFVWRGEPGA